jgi:hypothetical protein
MHGHMNVLLRYTVTWTYYDARSHERIVTMHGHMNVLLRCTVTWTYCYDARSHERIIMMHGHMNVLLRCTVTWTYCYDAPSHERIVMMHGHMNVLLRCTVTCTLNTSSDRRHCTQTDCLNVTIAFESLSAQCHCQSAAAVVTAALSHAAC